LFAFVELKAAVYLDTSGSNLPKLFEAYRNYVYDTSNAQLSELANDAAASSDNNAASAVLVIDDDDEDDAGKGGQGAEASFSSTSRNVSCQRCHTRDLLGC
jgi:mono/diheme cytochrome c family protein